MTDAMFCCSCFWYFYTTSVYPKCADEESKKELDELSKKIGVKVDATIKKLEEKEARKKQRKRNQRASEIINFSMLAQREYEEGLASNGFYDDFD